MSGLLRSMSSIALAVAIDGDTAAGPARPPDDAIRLSAP